MSARFFLVACGALALACSHSPEGPLPGASDAWKQIAQPSPSAKPAASPPWSQYAELRSWPALNAAPFTSQGHQPPAQVDLVASPASSDAYRALVSDTQLPQGTILAELAHEPAAADVRSYVMQKQNDGWSYLELDALGHVLAEGRLAACEGCHALAPADHAFGLPRSP